MDGGYINVIFEVYIYIVNDAYSKIRNNQSASFLCGVSGKKMFPMRGRVCRF